MLVAPLPAAPVALLDSSGHPKRTFLAALCTAQSKLHLSASSLEQFGYGMERCPSTATTPTGSEHDDSEYDFCAHMVSSDEEEAGEEADTPSPGVWSTPTPVALCWLCRGDDSACCSCIDVEDEVIAEGTGIPLDCPSEYEQADQQEEQLEDAEDDADLAGAGSTFCLANTWTGLDSLRVRHHSLHGFTNKVAQHIARDVSSRRASARDVRFFNHRVTVVGAGAAPAAAAASAASTSPVTPAHTHRLRTFASHKQSTVAATSHTGSHTGQGTILNPYTGRSYSTRGHHRSETEDDEEEADMTTAESKKSRRQALRVSTRGLAAATRPAIANTDSSKHRAILVARAARRQAVKQAQAAKADMLPRHLCKRSHTNRPSNRHTKVSTPAAAVDRSNLCHASSFDDFRRRFFARHQGTIEKALANSSHRAASVRLCPINGGSAGAFMSALRSLRPSGDQLALVYHGTHIRNMDSICRRGLLVPGRGPNPISIDNGAAYGVGIYSARDANYSTYYTRDCSTMFVCAAITTNAATWGGERPVDSAPAILAGQAIVLKEERRICPLFLLDFDPVSGSAPETHHRREPHIPKELARALLALMHTKMRAQNISRRDDM